MDFSAILLNWKRLHNLPKIIDSLAAVPRIREVIVWDNSGEFYSDHQLVRVFKCGRNICTFGRFRAVEMADYDAIYTQDDDVIVNDIDAILDLYDPDKIVASLTDGHMRSEAGRKPWVQLGWGSVFSRDSADVLNLWLEDQGENLLLHRKADRIFTILHGRHEYKLADVEPLYDPDGRESQSSKDALYKMKDHYALTQRASELALAIREKAALLNR